MKTKNNLASECFTKLKQNNDKLKTPNVVCKILFEHANNTSNRTILSKNNIRT